MKTDALQLSLELRDGRVFAIHPEPEPIPPGAVTEAQRMLFRVRLPPQTETNVFDLRLFVDDVPLERVTNSLVDAHWVWDPGFNAGLAAIQLTGLASGPIVGEVICDPTQAKLTRSQFDQMLGDILDDSLSLIALAGLRVGVARGEQQIEMARFEFLRSSLTRIEAAVREINDAPWLRVTMTEQRVALGRGGAVRGTELTRSIANGASLDAVDVGNLTPGAQDLARSLGSRLPRTVVRVVGREDHRRREHADMLAALQRWRGFLLRVRDGLERALRADPLHGRLLLMQRQCANMLARLSRLTQLPLFEDVVPTRGPLSSSHLFRRVDPYRRFFGAWCDFTSGIGDLHGDFLKLPLQRTFDLYELWCFLRLVRAAALDETPTGDWRQAFEHRPDATGLVVALRGKPFRFRAFTLVFQPEYREVWRGAGRAVGSFSRTMVPDIAIETSGETARPVIVLDAKYRVEEALNDAITSIHTYRDAIVESDGDNYRRAVNAGFVLTPNLPHPGAEHWRKETAPGVYFREEYRSMFRFGAVTMRPGVTLDECRALLRQLVASGE
jgi:hypothetical protein